MEVFNQVLLLRQSVLESQMTFKFFLSGSGNVLVSAGDLISPYCVIKCGCFFSFFLLCKVGSMHFWGELNKIVYLFKHFLL